jgi:hypothetical protein
LRTDFAARAGWCLRGRAVVTVNAGLARPLPTKSLLSESLLSEWRISRIAVISPIWTFG